MAVHKSIEAAVAGERLGRWLSTRFGAEVEISHLWIPPSSGWSAETFIFDAAWSDDDDAHRRALVARLEPVRESLFPWYDLVKEARVIEALGKRTDVAVPTIVGREEDPELLGAPFYVMEKVEGTIPGDDPPFTAEGWVLDLSPELQTRLWENAIAQLAAIHRADLDELGLSDLAPQGELAIDRQIDRWDHYYEWATEGARGNPIVDATFEWVRANRPEDEHLSLSWGDARLGNMLFDAQANVVGVLDWEMVDLASPELDLGWFLFAQRHHTEGVGLPDPPGFAGREESIARYEAALGRPIEHWEFYEVFAGLRSALVMVRIAGLLIQVGGLPPDATMALNNGATKLLTGLLDIDATGAEFQTFIGRRH